MVTLIWNDNSRLYMIRIYDRKAKEVRLQNEINPLQTNIKYYRSYIIKVNRRVHYKVVKEIIRIANAKKEEYDYAKEKFINEINFITIKARDTFPNGVSTVILKCYYGFNVVGVRDNIINEGIIVRDCL